MSKCFERNKIYLWYIFGVPYFPYIEHFADVYSNVFRCCVSQKYQKKIENEKISKKIIIFFYLAAFIFVSGNSYDLVLVFSERTLIS